MVFLGGSSVCRLTRWTTVIVGLSLVIGFGAVYMAKRGQLIHENLNRSVLKSQESETQEASRSTEQYSVSDEKRNPSDQIDIEPKKFPGDSIESVRLIYGNESSEINSLHIWKRPGYELNAATDAKGSVVEIGVEVMHKTVLRTPDGVLLGRATFADLLAFTQAHRIVVHEKIESGDGPWILKAYFPSLRDARQISVYQWIISSEDTTDASIDRGDGVLHSDVFLNQVADEYLIEQGKLDRYTLTSGGSLSIHK